MKVKSVSLALCRALFGAILFGSAPVRAGIVDHPAASGETCLAAPLSGTFLQPTFAAMRRPLAAWQNLFADLRSIGTRDIVLQWTMLDRQIVPPPDGQGISVLKLLDLARAHGMRVWVGLESDSGYWSATAEPPRALDAYFSRRLAEQRDMLAAMPDSILHHEAFAGWYISDEIDDQSWMPPERTKILGLYLSRLVRAARARALLAPVAISGFSNGKARPADLAKFWRNLAERADINLVLFQDGIGAGKLDLAESGLYVKALRAAFRGSPARKAAIVSELFRADKSGGSSADDKKTPTPNVPGPWRDIERQLRAEEGSGFPLYAFSLPDYMTPWAGAAAGRLFAEYKASLCGKAP